MFKNHFANQHDYLKEDAATSTAIRKNEKNRNTTQQGRQGNIEQNTRNQGYQQDR